MTIPDHDTTGSPSSKYEHPRASALLRNIQNVRICMGKKPIVSLTKENGRISIKNSLPYLKCVLCLSCVVHGAIDGRFIGFYVTVYIKTHKTAQADISVTMPDHRVITTFTLVKFLLSFAAFTKVPVSVNSRKMYT